MDKMLVVQARESEFGFKHPCKEPGVVPTLVTSVLGRRRQEDPLGLHLIIELWVQ